MGNNRSQSGISLSRPAGRKKKDNDSLPPNPREESREAYDYGEDTTYDYPGSEGHGYAKGGGLWIQKAVKRPGALHRALGVAEGKKIPASKLAEASRSENPRVRREAALAKTLKGFRHH